MKTARTLALSLLLAPAVAFAGDERTTRPIEGKNPDQIMTDARIAAMLHQVNKLEIDAGKLAQEQGQSQAVKDFGKMLASDHQAADIKLLALAKTAKLDTAPSNFNDKARLSGDEKKIDEVKKMKGADFDRSFAQAMFEAHDGMIKLLNEHGKEITVAALKQFVDDTIPALEHHRDVADRLKGNRAQGRTEPVIPRPIK